MPTLMGFGTFAALVEEQISEKISRRVLSGDQGMIVWWSIGAGVHVEPHSHANEQIVWMLKGKMEFRLGAEQRVCGRGDVVVIPGGAEHEAWFREDTEVIDFFAPPRDDFLLGRKPALIAKAEHLPLSEGLGAKRAARSMGRHDHDRRREAWRLSLDQILP